MAKVVCLNCSRLKLNRGGGLCWKCHRDPAVLARFGIADKPAKPRATGPECWACNALCPNGTHVTKAGWHRREIEINAMKLTEIYCVKCFAEWGWPPVVAVPDSVAE